MPNTKTKRVSTTSKGVRFQTRGKYKCVKVDGASQRGVHPMLRRALWPHWNYDVAKATGTLRESDPPKALLYVPPLPEGTSTQKRPTRYGKSAGTKFDRQMTAVVKHVQRHQIHHRDLAIFYDKTLRDHFLRLKYGHAACSEKNAFRNLCARLMPETCDAIHWLRRYEYTPMRTQGAVADPAIRGGTPFDLECIDNLGQYVAVEMKLGCERNLTNGKRMTAAPFSDRLFHTYDEFQLQALLTQHMYNKTHPERRVGIPIVLVCNRSGAHGYVPEKWAVDGFPRLLALLVRSAS